jgi:hypothetical protein
MKATVDMPSIAEDAMAKAAEYEWWSRKPKNLHVHVLASSVIVDPCRG